MNKTLQTLSIIALTLIMTACASRGGYQPLPPVKVITETVEVEVYAPPLPPEIQLNDVEWKVITNTPCKPATCLLYTSPSPRDRQKSRMPSSA